MAFNFNWSPLIADTSRARDMLTTALNKSPKPPIIVDDIIVTELNLGGVPPDLEILEIGDLAEDKFRGIFKMSYTGDAYLTLKTRVQANPLNTYLSTKPSFASPQPLAASSGLTIPLQITLSDIRLSGFVILVFSRQKGITVVFRNDPLESLKVSSTFDSIPFVRDYLQKEIEGQLRILFMDDLPAIIHRLSLRIWSSEYQAQKEQEKRDLEGGTETPINPLSSPPQKAFDAFGRPLDEVDMISLTSDSDPQAHASTFSQRNLLRLATLNDSHRTLSLFTPSLQDTVYRAWAGAAEKAETSHALNSPVAHTGRQGSHSTRSSVSGSSAAASHFNYSDIGSGHSRSSRPTLSTLSSTYSFSSSGMARGKGGRKRRHRVVNLRKQEDPPAQPSNPAAATEHGLGSRPSTPTSTNGSSRGVAASGSSEREGELNTPPVSPEKNDKSEEATPHARVRLANPHVEQLQVLSPQPRAVSSNSRLQQMMQDAPKEMHAVPHTGNSGSSSPTDVRSVVGIQEEFGPTGTVKRPRNRTQYLTHSHRTQSHLTERPGLGGPSKSFSLSSTSSAAPQGGSILEQAWMLKVATEVARRVEAEKSGLGGLSGREASSRWKTDFWESDSQAENADSGEQEDIHPPPAYAE